jgi:peptidoglycan/xylan/chitin deacetylase (PgdA/CDA1 family)
LGVEIGAHSMTHPDLRSLASPDVLSEAATSKVWLEQITGSEVPAFAFPFGYHNRRVARVVNQAGFKLARTLRYDHLRRPVDSFLVGVSVQAADASPLLVTRTWLDIHGPRTVLTDWAARAKRAFDLARKRDGVWHLWGHSWEIERNADWARLTSVLDYVAAAPGVQHLSNSQAFLRSSRL